MEDDDEFGDLYTDVLRPLQTPPIQPNQPSIDLNSQTHDQDPLHADSKSDPDFNPQTQTLASDSPKGSTPIPPHSSDSHVDFINSRQELAKNAPGASNSANIESGSMMISRVSKTQLEKGSNLDPIPTREDEIELDFDVEEADDGVIPGLSSGDVDNQGKNTNLGMKGEASDDWDSDSEDDLQIVLNDDNPEPNLIGGGEDGDALLVAESEPGHHQLMEDQDWGDDAAAGQTAEKEGGDAAKANGVGGAVAAKIGFSHQGYHPYHSQFKYVRPGAAPIPGAAPVGLAAAPGNVRPPMNAGLVAGRGRGDWWTATRNASQMQKGLHPGFGGAGRGSGMGLDFTLPSHKPIFDVDIDSFEEKPWRLPGIDASEFFNFGFSEDSWKGYCKQLDQQRLEGTMQSKIRVYESGRLQQENDPDMPPELAAASGIRGITSENPNAEKVDAPQSDAGKGSPLVRPTLPIGRPIQVEISSVERFPTMDTRQHRMRDLDAIIEIVLQDSADDDLRQENDDKEQPGNASSEEDSRGGHASSGDVAEEIVSRADGSPHPYNGRKRDFVGKRAPPGDSLHEDLPERDRTASSPKASAHYPDKDLERHREERQRKRTAGYRSPNMAEDEVSQEDSIESNGGKQKRHLSPSGNVKRVEELSVKEGNNLNGEMRRINRNPKVDANNRTDESPPRNVKKQKLSSRLDQEQSSNQTREDAGRSRENSKPRSGSSRDHHKLRNSVDEEFVQHGGHHAYKESSRRSHTEDEQSLRRKGPDGRHDTEKQRLGRGDRESSHSHKDRDPRSSHYTHGRTEGGVDNRRKALESSERVWRPDEEPLRNKTLVEEMRRRERSDEVGAGHRNKARDGEQRDDYGSSRDYHHKDLRLQHKERDVHAKSRYETLDDLHSNRRKEMEILRDADNIGRRKQERGDDADIRKKDNHVKTREDSHHSVKQKGDALDPRKADDRHSMRHREDGRTREGSLSKPEKEGRQGAKSGRILDDRSRVSHAALKDKRSDRDHESKDTGRRSEKHKKSDPVEDGKENLKVKSDDRRSRQEKSSIRNDRAVNVSETNREPESKHKENVRKRKESEGGNRSSMVPSKKKQEGQSELATSKSTAEGQSNEKHQSSKKHKEEASSDDEQKDSRRGRSKLERWTSNEERDFSVGSKSSSSLKVIKEMDYDTAIIPLQSSDASKLGDESSAMVTETAENQNPSDDQNADAKSVDKHLDTVEKLKKRSERFKLPMPIEKEAVTGKKMDSEPPLPPVAGNDEAVLESDIKQERPARKRRWISS